MISTFWVIFWVGGPFLAYFGPFFGVFDHFGGILMILGSYETPLSFRGFFEIEGSRGGIL